jgi:hypothetical protein
MLGMSKGNKHGKPSVHGQGNGMEQEPRLFLLRVLLIFKSPSLVFFAEQHVNVDII